MRDIYNRKSRQAIKNEVKVEFKFKKNVYLNPLNLNLNLNLKLYFHFRLKPATKRVCLKNHLEVKNETVSKIVLSRKSRLSQKSALQQKTNSNQSNQLDQIIPVYKTASTYFVARYTKQVGLKMLQAASSLHKQY